MRGGEGRYTITTKCFSPGFNATHYRQSVVLYLNGMPTIFDQISFGVQEEIERLEELRVTEHEELPAKVSVLSRYDREHSRV